jgi:serine protease Do
MAKTVVLQLREYGQTRRGWLGVKIQQVTPDIAESLGLKTAGGAMVAGVNDGGPADQAKIRNGDIILKFNNQEVKEMHNLPRIVAETPIGQEVPITVWREGHETTVQAKVGELPDDQKQVAAVDSKAPAKPTELSGLGLKLAPIDKEARDKFQLGDDQKGVVITDVAPSGPASERGLKPGDVIVEVQQQAVNSPSDVQSRLESVRKQNRKSVLMLIQSQDGKRWVPLPLSEAGAQKPG